MKVKNVKFRFFTSPLARDVFFIDKNVLNGIDYEKLQKTSKNGHPMRKCDDEKTESTKKVEIPFCHVHECDVEKISISPSHALLVSKDRRVFSIGRNLTGQLGFDSPNTNNKGKFTEIPFFKSHKVDDVCCGYEHSIVFTNKGVFAFGYNLTGCLGIGSQIGKTTTPHKVLVPKNISTFNSAEAGSNYTMFFCEENCMIYKAGRIFLESNCRAPLMEKFFIHKPIAVSTGGYEHYICLTKSRRLFSTGFGGYGQLGIGVLKNVSDYVEINFNKRIKQICSGNYHVMILTESNELYSFGYNECGELGVGDRQIYGSPTLIKTSERIEQIMLANSISFFIDQSHHVWGCGRNIPESKNKFVKMKDFHVDVVDISNVLNFQRVLFRKAERLTYIDLLIVIKFQ